MKTIVSSSIASIFIILLFGCGGSKKVAEQPIKPAPEWVKSRPISQTHYIGVGSSIRTMDMNQTQQMAKQNALADLASDISISISSNSLLSSFENNSAFTEDYSKTIKAQAEQDLEGYETVDNYEDQSNYWIYFKLSKLEYQRIKEERKNKAAIKSLDFFDKANIAESNGDIRLALFNLIKALEPIKPYFSDPIQIVYKGKDIFLGNEIYGKISTIITAIRIDPIQNQLNVKQGQSLSGGSLAFKINNQNNAQISGLPVLAVYSEKPIRNNKLVSDQNGIVSFTIDQIRSTKSIETFKTTLNLDAIVGEATTDFVIRKLFTRFRSPEGSISINIVKPTFFITSNETNLDEKISPAMLSDALKRKLIENGYTTTDKENDADYAITVLSSTKVKGEAGSYKQTALSCSISAKDRNSTEVYSKQIDALVGTHLSHQSAGLEAYKEAVKKIESTIAREFIDSIVKGKSAY